MERKFLMGSNDWLGRTPARAEPSTTISPGLRDRLVLAAMKRAYEFYAEFFGVSISDTDYDKLIVEYRRHFSHALSLGLLESDGISAKDHLNLWCLGRVLSPEVYVESGVLTGSSLQAFIGSPGLKTVVAIDPNLSELKVPEESVPGLVLIDDRDFSQIEIDVSDVRALAFFDDHINTANRILQAHKRGFRYLVFDDSTGLEGICQRMYPPIPTIPLIMNVEILKPGDELSWTFRSPPAAGTRVSLVITRELIDECTEAKRLIRKHGVIPDLGEFIPQSHPGRTIDTSKFIVELGQAR